MTMKPNTHPTTNNVIFVDSASGAEFITSSILSSEETREVNGIPHFIIRVEISSASHPFFTGEERFVDTAGRVDKFKEKLERVEAVAEKRKGKKAKKEKKAAEKAEIEAAKISKKEKIAKTPEASQKTQVEDATPNMQATEEVKTDETTTEA